MTRARPSLALVSAAAVVVAAEMATTSQARYGPECFAVGAALWLAWERREAIDARLVVALAVVLPATVAVVHLARHVGGDIDVQEVYPDEGRSLLDGTYPHSEYPPGAVLLFAFEDWVRTARTVNPFAMAACQGAIAWSIVSLRTPAARWAAALVALWPVDAFFWEFKFDALPTALLALGAVAALRDRWVLAGAAFGTGAAVKWSPAVAAVLLVLWLLSERRSRDAARHAAGFAAAFAVLVAPFLVWSPHAVLAAVSRQAPRQITPESVWYLPLHAVGQAHQPGAVYDAASVPHAANAIAVAVQLLVLLLLALVVVLRPVPLEGAVATALVGPAVFLLLNKVFSPQYAITVLATGCFAAVLVGRLRTVALLLAVATAANVLVYPIGRFWLASSAVLFVTALAAVAAVVRAVLTAGGYPRTT